MIVCVNYRAVICGSHVCDINTGAGSKMVILMVVLEFLQLMAQCFDPQFDWK